ncbi:MAG TPA: peptidoglycan editing factor PgeF [Syntrophomonadaceae bacterium]|nr:peptidoglycan editing factor PgeF [Syntrophomonadaceae bacterium]
MNKLVWQNFDGLRYINLPFWSEMGADILFTSRTGGFSEGQFASLNMALHVGDNHNRVIKNRLKVLKAFGSNLESIVCCEQVHGAEVAIINKEHTGLGADNFTTAIKGVDAMVTNISQICLTTFYADCIPIFLFDPIKRVIGIAHSGWKGTVNMIGNKTVQIMQDHYGCDLKEIKVFIGPGIGKCCFEIGEELGVEVKTIFNDLEDIIKVNERGFLWDLPKTNQQALIKYGIKKENIIASNLCTSCNTDEFFSYRQEKGKTGRMAAMIRLHY